jgi:hypothetical protein
MLEKNSFEAEEDEMDNDSKSSNSNESKKELTNENNILGNPEICKTKGRPKVKNYKRLKGFNEKIKKTWNGNANDPQFH